MKDIYSTSVCLGTLDEAPDAYKSMNEIKSAIVDSVDVIDILKLLYNIPMTKILVVNPIF
jgi:hypothetical protein